MACTKCQAYTRFSRERIKTVLILKQPIKFQSLKRIGILSDSFGEKIRWNYCFFTTKIEKEDLFYLLSIPPEIDANKEKLITIQKEFKFYKKQEIIIQVLNNLLNRIILAKKLSYQDMAYITIVLSKLGIVPNCHFLSKVKEIIAEIENTDTLIKLYQKQKQPLKQIFIKILQQRQKNTSSSWYLHRIIYKRLYTARNAYIVSEYAKNQIEGYKISNLEMKAAEAWKIAQELTVNQLRNDITGKEAWVPFLPWGLYKRTKEREGHVINKTEAWPLFNTELLFYLLNRFYILRRQSWKKGKYIYAITDSLYQAGEPLFRQIEACKEGVIFCRAITSINQLYSSEIQLLGQLLGKIESHARRIEISNRDYKKRIEISNSDYKKRIEIGNKDYEKRAETSNRDYGKRIEIGNRDYEKRKEISNKDYEKRIETSNKDYGVSKDSEYNSTSIQYNQIQEKTETYQEFKHALDQINQKNIEMYHKASMLYNQIPVYQSISINRERAKKDSIRALRDPEGVLEEYKKEITELEKLEYDTNEKQTALFSEETKAIYLSLLGGTDKWQDNQIEFSASAIQKEETKRYNQDIFLEWDREQEIYVETLYDRLESQWDQYQASVQREERKGQKVVYISNFLEKYLPLIEGGNILYNAPAEVYKKDALLYKQEEIKGDKEPNQAVIEYIMQKEVEEKEKRGIEKLPLNTEIKSEEVLVQAYKEEEITKMVRQGISQQINHISDQIYSRLEKKLANERKRRGF